MAIWSTVGLNGVNSVGGVVCLWACAVHPASSWTALGQVVAALLSLPSLFASACSPLCSIFLLTLRVCFLWGHRSSGCHWDVIVVPTRPLLLPRSLPLWPCHPPLVPCLCLQVPSLCPRVPYRLPLVPSHLPLLLAGGVVASTRSFCPRCGTGLRHHRRATLSPLTMASWLWSGMNSGPFRANLCPRTPYNLCHTLRVELSLVSCSLLLSGLGCLMVACCFSCIVVGPVSWLVGPSVSCVDTGVSPLFVRI